MSKGLKIAGIVLGVIIVVGGIGTTIALNQYDKKVSSNVEEEVEGRPYVENVLGDTVSIKGVDFKVTQRASTLAIGKNGARSVEADAGGKFLAVDVEIINKSAEPFKVYGSFFHLIHKGDTYDIDADATLVANQDKEGNLDNAFLYRTINHKEKVTATIVFDVPENVADTDTNVLDIKFGDLNEELFNGESIEVGLF